MTAVASQSGSTRTLRAGWNYLAMVSLSMTTMSIGLFATPWLQAWLGKDKYGAWRVVSDWCGFLVLIEMGFGGAVLAMLARAAGAGDRQLTEKTLQAAIRGYWVIVVRIILSGIALGCAMPWLVHGSQGFRLDLLVGYGLVLIGTFLIPLNPIRYFLDASQRTYVVSALLGVQSLILTTLALFFAHRGFGITGQAVATLVASIFFGILLASIGRREFPNLFRLRSGHEPELRKEMGKISRPIFIAHVCVMIGFFSDNIIIGGVLGAEFVTMFFLTQRLLTIALSQIRSISHASWAALIDLYVKKEQATFESRVIELTMVVTALGSIAFVPLIAFNQAFITLWVGHNNYAGEMVTLLAAVNGLLTSIIGLWVWLFDGTGRTGSLVRMSVISAIVNVLVSLAATKLLGLTGPLIGTLVALGVVQLTWLPILLRRHFEVRIAPLFGAMLRPLALAIPYGIALKWWAWHAPPTSWFQLVPTLAASPWILVAAVWLLLLSPEQRAIWVHRVRIVFFR